MCKLALEPLFFFPWKHHEKILCPDEFPRMCFKLADGLKLRPRKWSILRYLLSQFPNGHLFEVFYKHISLCLLNEKYVNWRTWRTLYPPLKYFIGYKYTKKIGPLLKRLSIMRACRRDFHKTKCMTFLIKHDKLSKNIMKFGKK